jgi:signal transduction histidine kinase
MPQPTIDELRTVIALRDLPVQHLHWILNNSEYQEHEDGALLSKTGDPTDYLWMIIEGKVNFYMDVNGRLIHYYIFENNEKTGGIAGLLPYSRLKKSPGLAVGVGRCRMVILHKKYFRALEQLNPNLIQRLIGYMTERARTFATLHLQQEKVSALGKLSAGIAHELNNPASAITRISEELNKRLMLNYDLTEKLFHHQLLPDKIKNLREKASEQHIVENLKNMTAFQKLERQDVLNDWLQKNGLKDCSMVSETFTEAGWTVDDLNKIRENVGENAFCDVILWLENLISSGWILKDLEEASTRISKLVGAIKSHVHMDRTNDWSPVNIQSGINNTLTLLGHKLRQKNISIIKNYGEGLPDIEGFAGELNQVWSNVIDNAIYALPQNGELIIETYAQQNIVCIKFADNGTGIPADIKNHIFEPYFTTKTAGDGSGIGLDIVKRIVDNHHGKIKVVSEPGCTEFEICLPIEQTHNRSSILNT